MAYMNLVTVTCERDFLQFSLQVESISKYCKNFFHYVIICEQSDYDHSKWEQLLKKYYRDNFKLFSPKWRENFDSALMDGYGGWAKQQVYKFWIYQYINSDYIILDSKNFFVKETCIEDFMKIVGSGAIEKIRTNIPDPYNVPFSWKRTVEKYAEMNHAPCLDYVLSIQTPFIFEKKILAKLGNIDNFCKKFSEAGVIPSEIIYYSYLIDKKILKDIEGTKTYCGIPIHYNFFRNIDNWYANTRNKHVIGIHHAILPKYRSFINSYLQAQNFDNSL